MLAWIRRRPLATALIVLAVLAAVFLGCEGDYHRPKGFLTLESLNRPDCRLGAFQGTGPAAIAQQFFPNADVVIFDDVSQAGAAMLGGRLEGFVGAEHVLHVICRRYPYRFRIMDQPLEQQPSRVLVAQKNTKLLDAVNAFIVDYKCSGVYDDMFLRWCLADEDVPMPALPESGTNGVLRVGMSGLVEPSNFIGEDGNLTGYDVEFALRLGYALGRTVEFHLNPRREYFDALRGGDLDVIIDNCNVPEPKPGVAASDGYLDSDTKVLIAEVQPGLEEHLQGLMLDGTQFGIADALIGDLRVRLFVNGFVNTASISLLAAILGFYLARLIGRLDRRSPRFVRRLIDAIINVIRWTPPLVLLLVIYDGLIPNGYPWITSVVAFAIWFAAFLEPVAANDPLTWLPVMRLRLPGLLQWTCVVGYINVFDMTMAVDLVCGRSSRGLVPLLAVALVYGLWSWLLDWGAAWYERRLRR